ncbi:hypothetical protein T492DRAFT_931701 [Pavlovales sp. CCMP2436]|nr:hypothetical protein T492DRAFT_931701 [Pavlovales sp. CCMP2436]
MRLDLWPGGVIKSNEIRINCFLTSPPPLLADRLRASRSCCSRGPFSSCSRRSSLSGSPATRASRRCYTRSPDRRRPGYRAPSASTTARARGQARSPCSQFNSPPRSPTRCRPSPPTSTRTRPRALQTLPRCGLAEIVRPTRRAGTRIAY